MNSPTRANPDAPTTAPRIPTPAAQRALEEAEARRATADAARIEAAHATEIDGRGGLEPVRFGDWEVKGLATDF